MSELDDLFPNCFLRERVKAHRDKSFVLELGSSVVMCV